MITRDLVNACFAGGVLLTVLSTLVSRNSDDAASGNPGKDIQFRKFQRTYLSAYLFGVAADWLQGPYVYALYEAYGFSREDNALLFVAGFGSSACFGTFIGAGADVWGRRKFAVLYCVFCAISCMMKHFNSYGILIIGRI